MEIDWDGTVKVLSDETDAGEFSMVVATFDDLTLDNLLDLAYTIEENKPNRQVWATSIVWMKPTSARVNLPCTLVK